MILGLVPVLISILGLLILISVRRRRKSVSMAGIHGTTFDTNLDLVDVDMNDYSSKSPDNRDGDDLPPVS